MFHPAIRVADDTPTSRSLDVEQLAYCLFHLTAPAQKAILTIALHLQAANVSWADEQAVAVPLDLGEPTVTVLSTNTRRALYTSPTGVDSEGRSGGTRVPDVDNGY